MAREKMGRYNYVAINKGKEIYFTTHKDGAEKLGLTKNVVSAALYGRSNSLDKKGISLFKIEEYDNLKPVREHKISDSCWTTGVSKKRKVHMLDFYTNEILDTYDSVADAIRDLGVNEKSIGNIGKCCRGKLSNAFGYKWEFAE